MLIEGGSRQPRSLANAFRNPGGLGTGRGGGQTCFLGYLGKAGRRATAHKEARRVMRRSRTARSP